jgi:hypothetical protein
MKWNVKIEFPIEGDIRLDADELKEMIYDYLAEAIEADELDYEVETSDEDELN